MTVTARDGWGAAAVATATVTLHNLPPVVDAVTLRDADGGTATSRHAVRAEPVPPPLAFLTVAVLAVLRRRP